MRQAITQKGIHLSRLLGLGEPCGGRGMCGKCDVVLRSGTWNVEGRPCTVTAPRHALACQTTLLSDCGEVEYKLQAPPILCDWACAPMPVSSTPAIGIDIGTTTIAAAKACDGQLIAKATRQNSQARFGDNVLQRISHAATPLGMADLRNTLLADLNAILDELGPAPVGIAANSILSLILHGLDPTSLGSAPFTLPVRGFLPCPGNELGLHCKDLVFTAPLPGAFIGGDIAVGMSVLDLQPGDMMADLGTNCEIVMRTTDGFVGAAAAAGPAFERTANASASELVEFLADNVACGNLDPRGLPCPGRIPRLHNGTPVPPKDIAALVLAKAAVRAGIDTVASLSPQAPRHLFLAGGFAKFLNVNAARAIVCCRTSPFKRQATPASPALSPWPLRVPSPLAPTSRSSSWTKSPDSWTASSMP